MTIFQAAREIQAAQSVDWSTALTWAHQCKRVAEKKLAQSRRAAENEVLARQRAFFLERRAVLEGERFRAKLRSMPVMDQVRLERLQAVVREGSGLGGGVGFEVYDCERERQLKEAC